MNQIQMDGVDWKSGVEVLKPLFFHHFTHEPMKMKIMSKLMREMPLLLWSMQKLMRLLPWSTQKGMRHG